MAKFLINSFKSILLGDLRPCQQQLGSLFHTSNILNKAWNGQNHASGPINFVKHNNTIFPPTAIGEEPRPAYVCHVHKHIKYSPFKMHYIANFVRGMSVDEAVKQLSFVLKKGAADVKQTILEAQEMAVKSHNVEFKSNLWVAESFVGKGKVIKGARRHGRGRSGKVEMFHCHYFVRLEEGAPPKDYYLSQRTLSPDEQLESWMSQMRKRKVTSSL